MAKQPAYFCDNEGWSQNSEPGVHSPDPQGITVDCENVDDLLISSYKALGSSNTELSEIQCSFALLAEEEKNINLQLDKTF